MVDVDGQTEVAEASGPVVGQPHVGWLEITVDDPAGVGVLQRGGDLRTHAQRLGDREATRVCPGQEILHRAAGHELTHDERPAVLVADVVDGDDVGMIAEEGHGLRFAPDAHQSGLVEALGLHGGQRHVAVQGRVIGGVDPFASTLAEESPNQIAAAGEGSRQRPLPACPALRKRRCRGVGRTGHGVATDVAVAGRGQSRRSTLGTGRLELSAAARTKTCSGTCCLATRRTRHNCPSP